MRRRVRVTANRQQVRGKAGDAKTYETDVKKAAPTDRRTPACTEPEVAHSRVRMEAGREGDKFGGNPAEPTGELS